MVVRDEEILLHPRKIFSLIFGKYSIAYATFIGRQIGVYTEAEDQNETKINK